MDLVSFRDFLLRDLRAGWNVSVRGNFPPLEFPCSSGVARWERKHCEFLQQFSLLLSVRCSAPSFSLQREKSFEISRLQLT